MYNGHVNAKIQVGGSMKYLQDGMHNKADKRTNHTSLTMKTAL